MANILKLEPKAATLLWLRRRKSAGMKLPFELDLEARRTRGSFVLGPDYAGGGGFAHGGIIAVVLDEAMGKLSQVWRSERAVTAEMNIEYRKGPCPWISPSLWKVGRKKRREETDSGLRKSMICREIYWRVAKGGS